MTNHIVNLVHFNARNWNSQIYRSTIDIELKKVDEEQAFDSKKHYCKLPKFKEIDSLCDRSNLNFRLDNLSINNSNNQKCLDNSETVECNLYIYSRDQKY